MATSRKMEGLGMSLYAIGDFHLSFSVDKPMDKFGHVWKNHEKKIEKNWHKKITENDTVVSYRKWSLPGAETLRRAGKIWNLSWTFPAGKYCFGGIMICSGMSKNDESFFE